MIDLEKYLDELQRKIEDSLLQYDPNLHQCEGSSDWKCDELPGGEMICYWPWDRPATQHQVNWCPFCGTPAKTCMRKE